jgi:hypothetical protein
MPKSLERRNHRVIKTLAPDDRGALDYARRYGAALICVRHRADAKGKMRHVTVELLVQSTPIRPRSVGHVWLRLAPHERKLAAVVETAGGHRDERSGLWRLPSRVASILSLRDRIVGTK